MRSERQSTHEARGAKSGGVPNIRRVSRFEETLEARLESHGLEKHLGFSPRPVSVSLERTVKAASKKVYCRAITRQEVSAS